MVAVAIGSSVTSPRRISLVICFAVVAAGCGENDAPPATDTPSASTNGAVQVVMANYELVAEESSRVLVGLILPDNRFVAYGSIQMRFTKVDAAGDPESETSQVVEGTYLPVPGTSSGDPSEPPQAITPDIARGAYVLRGVRFAPGDWIVEVASDVRGAGTVQGATAFEVLDVPSVPGVGERAPRSDNAVMGDPKEDPISIDSRAGQGGIPDPELHRMSIADAMEEGRPALVVFSTPVYCVSRFCGPVTDMVQELANRYEGTAEFIHVEVWKDFEANVANDAANEWLNRSGTLNEPWLFLIGPDGKILARWDNLFRAEEVEPALDALPSR